MKKIKRTKKAKILLVLKQILFWLSQAGLLIITWYLAILATLLRNDLFMIDLGLRWADLVAFIPGLTVVLCIVSSIVLLRKKRSESLFHLFFAVQLPLLLVGFGRVVFSTYSFTVIFLSLIILLSSLVIWYHILWGHRKNKFNKTLERYLFIPYILGLVMSGWLFLMWVFWVPYIGIEFFQELASSIRSHGFFGFLADILEVFWDAFTDLWWFIPALITGVYFVLSPALAFGTFLKKVIKLKFPRKALMIVGGIVVVVFGTFVLDVLEKRAAQADVYEAARKLNLSTEVDGFDFDEEDFQSISNLNRLKNSTQKLYIAQLKYPLYYFDEYGWKDEEYVKTGEKYSLIHEAVSDTYCEYGDRSEQGKGGYESRSKQNEGLLCRVVAKGYEALFFPLFYHGNLEEDRALAQKVYSHVFDASLQEDYASKITRIRQRSVLGRELWGGNMIEASVLAEKDEFVHLDQARYELEVNPELGVYTNSITYTFQNTTDENQEVYFEFELPDETAVITDLNLGLNLELPSQVAPRGAAKAVYEASIRRRIDPALLEKVGPRQYKLRVFPVLPESDERTQGVQNVQLEYTAFIPVSGELSINTPMTTRNLEIDRNTSIIDVVNHAEGYVLAEDELSLSDLKEGSAIHILYNLEGLPVFSGEKTGFISGPESSVVNFYYDNHFENTEKMVFFLDQSNSANTLALNSFYDQLRQNYSEADFYTYNFQVEPLAEAEAIDFWGPTNTQVLAEFLTDFTEATVYVVSDESNFEIQVEEDMTLNYSHFADENQTDLQVNAFVVGNHLPLFKNELSQVILASEGGVHRVDPESIDSFQLPQEKAPIRWQQVFPQGDKSELQPEIEIIDEISVLDSNIDGLILSFPEELGKQEFPHPDLPPLPLVEAPKWREAVEDLWAAHNSHLQLQQIEDEASWLTAAEAQNDIASRAHIVNTFSSLIAVENQWQQDMLDREKDQEDKYRSDHDIGEANDRVLFDPISQQRGDEPSLWLVLAVIIILSGFVLVRKRV